MVELVIIFAVLECVANGEVKMLYATANGNRGIGATAIVSHAVTSSHIKKRRHLGIDEVKTQGAIDG